MKKEYDFSNAERGKFFIQKATMHLPIYLEPDIEAFKKKLQKKRIKVQYPS